MPPENRNFPVPVPHTRTRFVPRGVVGGYATYGPPRYRIDGHAPQAAPNDLSLSQPHDWSGFDKTFHPAPRGGSSPAPAAPANAQAKAPETFGPPAPTKAPTGPSTVSAAPKDINGSAVQGLLDRAAGVTSPPAGPPNPGTLARESGQQQTTRYGTVGADRPTGTPIIENGKTVGIQGSPSNATLAELRTKAVKAYPALAKAGTPENTAFVDYYNKHGEAATHQNLDAIMKSAADKTMEADRSKAAQVAQEKTAGDVMGQAEAAAAADKVAAAKADAGKQAQTAARQAQAVQAVEDQRTFESHTPLGVGEDVVKSIPAVPGKVADFLGSTGRSMSDWLGIKPGPGPSVPADNLDVRPGEGKDKARVMGFSADRTPEQLAYRASIVNQDGPSAAQPAVPSSDGTDMLSNQQAQPAPAGSTASVAIDDGETQNYAGGMLPGRTPFTPGLDRLKQMQTDKAAGMPLASASRTPGLDARVTGGGGVTAAQTPGLDRLAHMQASSAAGAPLETASATPGLDAMAEDNVANLASGFAPGNSESPGERAAEQSWKSNMQSAQLALRGDLKAAGYPNQAITTQTLAGHPEDTVPGYNPTGNPQGEDWDGETDGEADGETPNYARGRRIPGGDAKGKKLFAPAVASAMAREKAAIRRGVGGAPKTARPEAVLLAGKPAVINSSEKVVPNAAGGYPAVLTRNMQKRAGMFVPGRGRRK